MKSYFYIFLFLVLSVLVLGCSGSSLDKEKAVQKVKIAVVLKEENRAHWDRIMQLAQKNISEATDIYPVFEFYDEDSNNIMRLAYDLARDESIVAVIGCEGEENTETLAYQFSRLKTHKPMFTFNTSQEVIRKYATQGFMWGLSESDITQSEVLLTHIAIGYPSQQVSLLASKGSYGQTFVDWFAFQAQELGLKPGNIYIYEDISEIEAYMEILNSSNGTYLCVPANYEEAIVMVENVGFRAPYFTHKAFDNKLLDALKDKNFDIYYAMNGATLVADPSSGFQNIYESRYNETPIFGEAQVYDAIMITSLAYAASKTFDISVNQAVSKILSMGDKGLGDWTKDGIAYAYESIVERKTIPAMSGAIGRWSFVPDKHTIIQYSTYAIQYMSGLQFHITDYLSRGGGKNTSSVTGAWEWDKVMDQDFKENQDDYDYGLIAHNKAVIVAASSEWSNYRHQADALDMYHYLKSQGFQEDDIILIMADDIANNPKNPYPGAVYRVKGGKNVYQDVVVDYKLSELTPQDFRNIMMGNSSEHLSEVLETSKQDNIFLFWSGHGRQGSLLWNKDEKTITGDFMSQLFKDMYSAGKYRNIFAMIETCYAGSVAKACEGIPGLLLMTAANDKETSKAEGYSSEMGTYLTNSFTDAVLNVISKSYPSLASLYHETFRSTMGSHVMLYNVENFGNVYSHFITEFMMYYKW